MKILKRNQIIISVIALMLITVGYLNYSSNISKSLETSNVPENSLTPETELSGIGDARLVNGEVENMEDSDGVNNSNEKDENLERS